MFVRALMLNLCLAILTINLGIIPANAAKDQEFSSWLRDLDAWDAFAREMARQNPTQETVLSQAEALIFSDNPEEALGLLNAFGHFDGTLEGRRLWLKGRAQRQLGLFPEAVLDFAEACSSLDPTQALKSLREEPRLETLWDMVWTRWFWDLWKNPNQDIVQARHGILDRTLSLANQAWPNSRRWQAIAQIWALKPLSFEQDDHAGISSAPSGERVLLVRALAAWSVGFWSVGHKAVEGLSNADQRNFWFRFGEYLKNGAEETSIQAEAAPSMELSFWEVYRPQLRNMASGGWALSGPNTLSWPHFLARLSELSPGQALQAVRKEKESSLLDEGIRSSLSDLEIVFRVLDGDLSVFVDSNTTASHPWDHSLCLALSRILAKNTFPDTFADTDQKLLILSLANAGGVLASPSIQAPFWTVSEQAKSWPLDPLLLYTDLAESLQSPEGKQASAAMLAFLYSRSVAGQRGFLVLAQEAHGQGRIALAWKYVREIDEQDIGPGWGNAYLLARAGLEMEQGMEAESLQTYKSILEITPESVTVARRLKLALLAQRLGQWTWAQDMLEKIWSERDGLPRDLQAETLFWMGEGAQYLGNEDQALDYYLILGWKFPEQNIWALTALYRAGLIYENQGRFTAASRLFSRVAKNADRKSQKEAAEQRVKALEKKTGQAAKGTVPLF
ncbi:MAG: hypothetical protein EOM25_00020 [Deltaproteobacteria bacterium]|nr:hypothetical protein [Deltaproteobacteria bacterium]